MNHKKVLIYYNHTDISFFSTTLFPTTWKYYNIFNQNEAIVPLQIEDIKYV